jgi:uncharacterized linocin/CFP29 family protein
MEWLRRSAAPLSEKVWKEVDELAGSMFKQTVVARRIADFDGPRGWNHVALSWEPSNRLRSQTVQASSALRSRT